jgi:GNAT superfamily N-acetyltransferase
VSELLDFAEAMGPFLEPAPGRLLRLSDGYSLSADVGDTWAQVERIRLREVDLAGAIQDVDSFMHGCGSGRASWWLTERSTPDESAFLAAGLRRVEADYLHAAMVLTTEPPAAHGIEVRRIETLEEYAESRRLALAAFANPVQRIPSDDDLVVEWEHAVDPRFAAWLDGRMASVGRAVYTRAGGYLMGGSTAEWARGRGAYRAVVRARWDEAVRRGTPALAVGAGSMSRPILERLGFEQVLQFRRLESVRSDA